MSSVPLKCVEVHENQVASEKNDDDIKTVGTFRRILPQVIILTELISLAIEKSKCFTFIKIEIIKSLFVFSPHY